MATIDERAAIITVEVIAAMVQVIEHKDAETINGIKKYIVRELENQRKIDIEKACECFRQELGHFIHMLNVIKEGSGDIVDVEGSINSFRKAMEE